ncbi:hypothetical protein QZH41_009919, partial [Actinostola sp. cb2023]
SFSYSLPNISVVGWSATVLHGAQYWSVATTRTNQGMAKDVPLAFSFSTCFSGIGIAMITISFLVSIYYNVILAWSVYFLYSSFQSDLPWVGCHHSWNTPDCYNGTRTNGTGISPSRQFLEKEATVQKVSRYRRFATHTKTTLLIKMTRKVLEITNSIDEPGSLNVHLTVSLLIAWVLVYFCIWRGIRTTGKVVYVTATLPYVILLILFIKGLTLPGSRDGILYYITPQWDRLTDPAVWIGAASQILYSLTIGFGVIISFASYNKQSNNIYRDALTISLVNCITSIFAGFVIFTFVGFMAHEQGKTVPEVASQGPGLVFIVYPEALAQLPYPHIWSVIFFLMLVVLGIDSQVISIIIIVVIIYMETILDSEWLHFGQVEVVAGAIIDHFPRHLHRYRELVALVICAVMYLIGLSCVTQGGMYVFNLFDSFSCGLSLLFLVITELITVGWIYGARRFANDIQIMIGHPVSLGWVVCWKFVSPIVVILIFIVNLVKYKPITYEGRPYPAWAEALGWVMTFASVLWVPCVAIYKILTTKGSLLLHPSRSHESIQSSDKSPDTANKLPEIQELDYITTEDIQT